MTKPKRFIEIDCTSMCDPLHKLCGFDSLEEYDAFIYKMAHDKKEFLFKAIMSKCKGEKLSQDDEINSVTPAAIEKLIIASSKDWLELKIEEYKGTPQFNVFTSELAFPFNIAVDAYLLGLNVPHE
ncbi:hypothetical protein [Vibrio lentus]|uniref:hypothetical protein n=1 Tax=Vibrio lentus TaxID=136468 RepID=UPI000C859C17|nr:hypothetical protein [Vibrio lentus]PMM32475.1 hypothetical protein BCT58_26910 [Vibrio lentus]